LAAKASMMQSQAARGAAAGNTGIQVSSARCVLCHRLHWEAEMVKGNERPHVDGPAEGANSWASNLLHATTLLSV
jgi:hypothetical protein